MTITGMAGGAVARVFLQQPERVAAAWRRVRYSQVKGEGEPLNLLDSLVESFVQELGQTLDGAEGSAWSRTRGVLRLSPERGAAGFHIEFAALKRCLRDAIDVLGGSTKERRVIDGAVDEALDSAVAHLYRLSNPAAEPPRVPFGGLAVEFFERAARSTGNRPAALRQDEAVAWAP